jgi:hypothetical protein
LVYQGQRVEQLLCVDRQQVGDIRRERGLPKGEGTPVHERNCHGTQLGPQPEADQELLLLAE